MNWKHHIRRLIEHNEHYVTVKLFGREIHPCARCFGKWLGILFTLPIGLLFFMGKFHTTFTIGFITSWLLALPSIVDWISIKYTNRDGSNRLRFITGFLLGAGIVTYFLIMPATWMFKFSTFLAYEIIFGLLILHKNYGITDFITNPKYTFSCIQTGCCCGACDPCVSSCVNGCICLMLMVITLPILCCIFGMFKKEGKK